MIGQSLGTTSLLFAFGLTALAAPAPAPNIADAARTGDKQAVRALLAQKADVNAVLPDGATALHWAAESDDLDSVQLLLKAGANPKA